ncbi:MAG: PASTA domain-containing protein [Gemmatimonadales bacterium]
MRLDGWRATGKRLFRGPLTVAGRRRIIAALIVVIAVMFGYLVTMVIFPAPLIGGDTPVTRVIGLPAEEAERRLIDQGFRPRVDERETDPAIPAGHILWQDPPPGVELTPNTPILLTVSDGPASVPVPDVTEFSTDQAIRILLAGGLRLGTIDSVAAPQPAGVVLSTRPAIGSSLPSGSTVDLVVSRGPATIRVPNVVGMDRIVAQQALEAAGLRVGTIVSRPSQTQATGSVLEQRPGANTLSPRGGRIDLIIVRPEES